MRRRVHHHRYGRHADHAGKPQRYIAKCRACKAITSGTEADVWRYELPNAPPYYAVGGDLVLKCRSCGHPAPAKAVRGKYNPGKPCSARCLASTRPVCECSCAGKNHGAGWSA